MEYGRRRPAWMFEATGIQCVIFPQEREYSLVINWKQVMCYDESPFQLHDANACVRFCGNREHHESVSEMLF